MHIHFLLFYGSPLILSEGSGVKQVRLGGFREEKLPSGQTRELLGLVK